MFNQEYAGVLPNQQQNPVDTIWQQKQYADAQQKYQDQVALEQKRYDQHRQDQALQYAMDKMDWKNFATGTYLDPTIHQSLDGYLKDVTKKIAGGEYGSNADMMYDIARSVSDISNYSNTAKNISAAIHEGVKAYAKNPSVDMNRLTNRSMAAAFLKYDPQTNSVTIRNPNELDPRVDYVGNVLNERPEDVLSGNEALYNSMEKLKSTVDVGDSHDTRDKSGHRIKVKYSARVNPWEKTYLDEKTDRYNVQTNLSEEKLSNGQAVKALNKGAYDLLFGSDEGKLIANAAFNRAYSREQRAAMDDATRDILKRQVAGTLVDGAGIKGGVKYEEVDQQRLPRISVNVNTMKDNEDDRTIDLLKSAAGVSPFSGETFKYKGDEYENITSAVKDGVFYDATKQQKGADGTIGYRTISVIRRKSDGQFATVRPTEEQKYKKSGFYEAGKTDKPAIESNDKMFGLQAAKSKRTDLTFHAAGDPVLNSDGTPKTSYIIEPIKDIVKFAETNARVNGTNSKELLRGLQYYGSGKQQQKPAPAKQQNKFVFPGNKTKF